MSRNIEDLHPSFQPIVREVLRRADEAGLYPFITEGRRAPEYQACLYAQGRLLVGKSATYNGLAVVATLSQDGKSVIVRCGKASNVVPLRRWSGRVTQVGPYGSWHVLGLAVDVSFRSARDRRDDLIDDLEEAIAEATRAKEPKRAAQMYALIAQKYEALAGIWDQVAKAAIWGNDWDDDGILNGPDPDNEWSDLPHFEWHPGLKSVSALSADQVKEVMAGRLPVSPIAGNAKP